MNVVWLIITASSVAVMLFLNPDGAIAAMSQGANKAVSLALSLLAGYSLWLGLFNLIEKIGWQNKIARLLRPIVNFLFPNASEKTVGLVSMNISANLIGLGNAATPMGINAVCSMSDGSDRASDNMIMLLVLSATSLQLIPSTVIGMRVDHGSAAPVAFLPACLTATVISTALGIILVKIISRLKNKNAARSVPLKRAKRGIKP